MKKFIAIAFGAAALAGFAGPAVAQDYHDDRRGGYDYDRGNHSYDRNDDDDDYGRQGYGNGNGYGDGRYANERGSTHYRHANRFRARGEGWALLRSVAGYDATRDWRFVRWASRFDRNRDGILDRYEGYRARAAYVRHQPARSGYAYSGNYRY